MSHADQQDTRPAPQGAEQRAFPRYPIRLPAVCRGARPAKAINCEIRDFCVGGMYLLYGGNTAKDNVPQLGDTIEIVCCIPDTAGRRTLRFLARVVRAHETSSGVALLDVDLSAIQAMQRFAAAQFATQTAEPTPPPAARRPPARGPATIDSYRRIVAAAMPSLMHAFLDNMDRRLYELAERASDMSSQSLYLGTQGTLQAKGPEIKERMATTMAQCIAEIPGEQDPAPSGDGSGGLTLALMPHDELENWLAVSDLVNHVELAHQALLKDIEARLSYLHRLPISDTNNPIGPAVFANAFREAIGALHLEHSMKLLCFNVFKETLGHDIGDIYQKVNKLLVDDGILPDLKPTIVHMEEKRRPGTPPAPTTPPADDGNGANPATAAPEGPRPTARTAPAPTPIPAGRSTSRYPDLYQIVSDLQRMQQQFGGTGGTAASPSAPGGSAPAPTFDTDEILSALTQLQGNDSAPAAEALSGKDLQARILSALAAHHPNGGKQIGDREKGIMDVAGNLFESLLQDMMVAKSVRSWLNRLKVPMLKLAIQDDSLFLDKSHTARQVMNRLAQLELYGEDKGQNAIQRRVDALLDRIVREVDGNPAVFSTALKELDLLLKIQNEAYSDNVRDVITRCEQQARDAPPSPGEAAPQDAQQTPWQKRARRLRIGNWVLFTSGTAQPQRLRLAWSSRTRDHFVFVNLRGLEELSLSVGELSRRLREGSAVVLDDANEPAVDRAQHAMLQKLHHQLLHQSTHDQLTGLINRREFERRIDTSLGEAGGCGKHCLCHLDIDQLSVINTTCGYGAGDRLLAEIAGLVRRVAGHGATVARTGDDDFGILLANRSRSQALDFVNQLFEAVRGYRFEWQDKRFSVSFGVGLVQSGEQGMNAAAMLQAAESSCRSAKARGINQVQVYHPDDTDLVKRRNIMQWVSRIDQALDEGSLVLRCQRIMPLQEAQSGRAHHYEVLLGVTDESGKIVSPVEFIAAAERYNRMQAVDRWVIRGVFEWMAAHRDRLPQIGGFAINLSGRSLSDDTLIDYIREEAARMAIPMERVCFEVTETAGISNLSDAAAFIMEIKETGCRFSLDDFGSGLSSYTYLKNLPVDYLKIDGAFVREMNRNPSDFAVVKSICEIGHFMGKKVIAEYAESQDIIRGLRELGVDYAQGHMVELPRPLDELAGPVTETA